MFHVVVTFPFFLLAQYLFDDFNKVLSVFLFLVFPDTTYIAELFEGGRALGGKQMQGLVRKHDVGRNGLLVGQSLAEDA